MIQGHVKLQTLALFSQRGSPSVERGEKQVAAFLELLKMPQFAGIEREMAATPHIHLIAACENASVFALENEPLEQALHRLQQMHKQLGHIFYITMTWNEENRFGGGNDSRAGLKSDGKALLEFLSGKKIAVDLSHTSDRFAAEIIEHIDALRLDVPLLASHSNYRAVASMPRNLPDAIAREIIRRKGIIGLNFFAPFIGKGEPKKLMEHIQHALSLGGHEALCFGADFFCDQDGYGLGQKYPDTPFYFPEYSNASCYPKILASLAAECGLSAEMLTGIAYGNALRFLTHFIL
jgi:microsomal dipeptidase-like Zn-dependent dipeptidase